MLAIIVLIVMGLVSVIGSEMLSVAAPSRFDLTNDSIVLIMAPAVLGTFYLLFWRERT